MRSILGHWREIASIVALVAGLSSLSIGSCSLNRSYQTSKTLQDVIKTTDTIKTTQERSKKLEDMYTQLNKLETRTENIEDKIIYTWYSWSLFSIKGPDFIKERQELAANSEPRYIESSTSNKFKTTPEGRALLTTEQMEKVKSLIEKDKSILESQVILELGIEKLWLQAKTHKVSLDIIIGVVASYTQEVKQETQ